PFADDEPLLCTIAGCTTTGDARLEAQALCERLASAGLKADQAVAVQLPNGPEAVVAMFGTWLAGGVFVPLNQRQTETEVDAAMEATQPATFLGVDGVRSLPGAARVFKAGSAFVTWTSGTTGMPK